MFTSGEMEEGKGKIGESKESERYELLGIK